MKIGVAISTRNRRAVFNRSLKMWQRMLPEDATLVVVDDASDDPVPDIDGAIVIRHPNRLGVAMTKNDCIAALIDDGCDHLFLVDDDIYPVRDYWWRLYVDSPEPHLSYQGGHRKEVQVDEDHYAVDFPRGYMLYATREVIDTVGGMDPMFGMYGGEHVEWQTRIYECGLTGWKYADAIGANEVWSITHSGSTIGNDERRRMLKANDLTWQKHRQRYISYRQGSDYQEWIQEPVVEDVGTWPLLRHVLDLGPQGTALEFGVYRGDTARIIAERMPLVGFDSGQGLPEHWRPGYGPGTFACSLPKIDNARMVEGWFSDTLPSFDFAALGYIGLVNIDCDLYSSTKTVLEHIGPHLLPGCFVHFDEMFDYPGYQDHEMLAWREYADANKIGWTVVGYGPSQKWAIRIT